METRKIIDEIEGRYDVLVGVFHMGLTSEYGEPNSGVTDILNACPEFDVMISAHAHMQIAGEIIGDYIHKLKHGVIKRECNNNWKLTGYEWDDALHTEVVEKVAAGKLTIQSSEDGSLN